LFCSGFIVKQNKVFQKSLKLAVKYHPEIEYSRGTIFLNSQTEGDILVVFL
jgi:hypothetical protein